MNVGKYKHYLQGGGGGGGGNASTQTSGFIYERPIKIILSGVPHLSITSNQIIAMLVFFRINLYFRGY